MTWVGNGKATRRGDSSIRSPATRLEIELMARTRMVASSPTPKSVRHWLFAGLGPLTHNYFARRWVLWGGRLRCPAAFHLEFLIVIRYSSRG